MNLVSMSCCHKCPWVRRSPDTHVSVKDGKLNGAVDHGATKEDSFITVSRSWLICDVLSLVLCWLFHLWPFRMLPKCAAASWSERKTKSASPLWPSARLSHVTNSDQSAHCLEGFHPKVLCSTSVHAFISSALAQPVYFILVRNVLKMIHGCHWSVNVSLNLHLLCQPDWNVFLHTFSSKVSLLCSDVWVSV